MKLSVVMAVYNGAHELPATLDSILAQSERDFELIVVDDGSIDGTPNILANCTDSRLRVITQSNAGLTRALIRGCDEARASVIARHDCGDRSHPERFAKQLALLAQGHVLVSCATKVVERDGELLYISRADGDELRRGLLHGDAQRIRSIPHHGSAMFRRDAYRDAGGYRAQFRLAQDLDLWIRLAQLGTIGIVDEVLYEAAFDARGISGASRDAQLRLTQIAVALRDGGDANALLDEASRITSSPRTPQGEAAALYFIGKCLLDQKNAKGKQYLREAIARDPWNWRARVALLLA